MSCPILMIRPPEPRPPEPGPIGPRASQPGRERTARCGGRCGGQRAWRVALIGVGLALSAGLAQAAPTPEAPAEGSAAGTHPRAVTDPSAPRPGPSLDQRGDWEDGRRLADALRLLGLHAAELSAAEPVGLLRDGMSLNAGHLPTGGHAGIVRVLQENQTYTVLAAGDPDATALHLEIKDDQGRVVAHSPPGTATPRLRFTPPRTGRYVIKLWLKGCRAAGAAVGFFTLEADGYPVGLGDLERSVGGVLKRARGLHDLARKRGADGLRIPRRSEDLFLVGGMLPSQRVVEIGKLILPAGMSIIVAGGDGRAEDIDMGLFTPSGLVVAEDDRPGPDPVVVWTGDVAGDFDLLVANLSSPAPSFVTTLITEVAGLEKLKR